ncbi:MAG: hypothetical protein U0176_26870, partial [Bacteroidia bacterium]
MRLNAAIPFLFALVLGLSAQAQLYLQPQPLMFDKGLNVYAPHPGLKRMVMSRYIPGARFPKDYDVVVETYGYDQQGRIVETSRFDNIMGNVLLTTTFTYTPEGKLAQERTVTGDRNEVIRKYNWEKDANGKPVKATIVDRSNNPIGSVEVMPDGSQVISETSGGAGKVIKTTLDANGRLLRIENGSTGQTEDYSYYPDGTVKQLDLRGTKGVAQVKYDNTLDDKGHVIKQVETGKTGARTFLFTYTP